ncbi:MAG TPA: isoniazid response ATPase/transcriptional regulator IniR [Mycobacterium sp.]
MTGALPHEVPPQARDLVDAIAAEPTAAVKAVVVGGMGTGKTATLSAIRASLRRAGVVVTGRPASAPQTGTAVVVDDAHLLPDAELSALVSWAENPATTVVVATPPYQHNSALRALTLALQRENPPVLLGALPAIPTNDDGSIAQSARFALIDRLRAVEGPVLDALLIASLSPDLAATDVAAALHLGSDEAQTLVDRARGSGLVEPSHGIAFLHSVHRAAAQVVGAAHHREVETSLLSTQLEMEALSADLALRLAEHGVRDPELAAALARYAERAAAQPGHAARLYRAAADAGATDLGARLADALALAGDCTAAGRLADGLLGTDDAAERAAAVRVAASVAAHDGNAGQAADLFRWLGPHPDAAVGAAAAVTLIGAGDATAARAASTAQDGGPPTTSSRAARSLADGLLLTLEEPFAVAIGRLGQSLAAGRSGAVAPDTPAALITLAALHGGDSVRARSVISRAVAVPADEFSAYRHRLLLGWVKMLDGQLGSAAADVGAVDEPLARRATTVDEPLARRATSPAAAALHRRDALWAAALRTGIARRGSDSGGLHAHWYVATEVLAEYALDLYSLLPLGELWIAAARLRQVERLQHALDEAFALLESLGNPVLWSVPLHWAGVHAGILASSPNAVAPHAQALKAAAATSPFARALAGAGRVWLRVLANQVDVDEVTAAARGLAEYGHTWEATRLASQAALQTPDARIAGAMLQLARDLKVAAPSEPTVERLPGTSAPTDEPLQASAPGSARLSEREREVAELLVQGMPYRDIGSQLFISAKTVEHHVARIRRRLGAESRTELLSMLRALLAPPG